ncbi:kinase [Thalictrum thalictroides]|uniref:Kinase n=1 Tax=Thalictrum thalictroides TaxID=46969 RepID=A0A7J6X9J3_THATH|nr:kinase [Thalictrum thalictroides]
MADTLKFGRKPSKLSRSNKDVQETKDNKNPIVQNKIENLLIDPKNLFFRSIISEGPNSTVYEALYQKIPVAVKVIQPGITSATSSESKGRFVREVRMLTRVKHDNLVKFIGASMEPHMLIVTELMKGGSLHKYLYDMRPCCPDLQTSISFALDIAQVMECLHSNGIIHRDLKPSNLLLTEDQKKVKLADFGLAREETVKEMMTTEVGTYQWMAPELYSTVPLHRGEKKHYDHKVDIYSFSIVLWELLTNSTPFKGMSGIQAAYAVVNNQRPSLDDLPPDLVPLLESCWAEDPASRPEFKEIIVTLSNFVESLQLTQNPRTHQQNFELGTDSPGTRSLVDKSGDLDGRKSRSSSPKFLRCFDKCFSN